MVRLRMVLVMVMVMMDDGAGGKIKDGVGDG